MFDTDAVADTFLEKAEDWRRPRFVLILPS